MTRKRRASDRKSAQKVHDESPKNKRDAAELRSQIMRSVRQEQTVALRTRLRRPQ
jgi:hypothetical protein